MNGSCVKNSEGSEGYRTETNCIYRQMTTIKPYHNTTTIIFAVVFKKTNKQINKQNNSVLTRALGLFQITKIPLVSIQTYHTMRINT